MMRRVVSLCVVLAVMAYGSAESRELMGSWTARSTKEDPGKLYLSLESGRNEQHGSDFGRAEFTGLTSEQIESSTRVPVQFELRREAGTVAFDGTFRAGRGAGDFSFVGNPNFAKQLRSTGVPFRDKDIDDDSDLLNLALFDVSIAFIRSMQAIGYNVSLDKYVAFRIFGVDPAYVREMAAVRFDHLSADKLTETRIHGATPEYIRQMRAGGEDLTLDQYIESRIFQVTPEFAQEMAKAGYPGLDRDVLVQFKIHGVSTDFIQDLREVGYSRLPAQKLVEMRIHGVTPEFIRRVEKAGYHQVPVDKLVQMRIFDIQPEMIRALDDAGR